MPLLLCSHFDALNLTHTSRMSCHCVSNKQVSQAGREDSSWVCREAAGDGSGHAPDVLCPLSSSPGPPSPGHLLICPFWILSSFRFFPPFLLFSFRSFFKEAKHPDVAPNAAAFACTHHPRSSVMAIDIQSGVNARALSYM